MNTRLASLSVSFSRRLALALKRSASLMHQSSESIDHAHQRFRQNVIVMRHGDRIDNAEPLWVTTAVRPWDPPLTEAGKVRAFCTGRELRDKLGFRIHRVFVSPFLRCIQTASQVVSALCAVQDDPTNMNSEKVAINPSKLKVSIEYGLCEIIGKAAIRPALAPKDGDFGFNIPELEEMLPTGTVDHSVERVYQQLPKWEESVTDARFRYENVIRALADKFPTENLLLVTHGSFEVFTKNSESGIRYCPMNTLAPDV
ncbi:PREDICTED: uncharacterized protein LOC104598455 isoform X2 [Nelumbo nucifera]|uniref:Uncharacterized protein LOC104598455 isoform X2 n=1 Tax=Nelumbo nucifera TaxID=4432 RepID=A0A1U8A9W8_NELNU|nr:PREDICTED: uncharacterized protein LOC104598455 isoform X2 [Nelumbo nucifera]